MVEFLAFLVVLLIIVAVVLLTRTSDLSSKMQELRWEVGKLAARLALLEEKQSVSAAPGVPPKVEAPSVENVPVRSEVQSLPPVPAPPPEQVEVKPPLPPEPPPAPSRTHEEWEALIGGKLLNRIGALALIIGVGFFLKYAFDKNWIMEWMRVAIGGLTGVGLLLLAARSHRKGLGIFAQGLVGAGIAILYLSVYASFNFYSLVSQPVAFVLMSGVTAIAFLQAFKYDSLTVSLLGWLGGFLTPFLLSTGEANAAGLFTYLALLDVAVLAVLLVKHRWIVLLPMTLVGTYLLFYLWYAGAYQSYDAWTAVTFLSIFWGLFHLLDTAWCVAKREAFKSAWRWGSTANAIAFYYGLYTIMDQDQHDWLAPATLLVGIIFAVSAVVIQKRAPTERLPVVHNAIAAVVLLVTATQIQFEAYTVIMVFALEAVLLAWMGRRWGLRYVWYIASAVLLWGALVLVGTSGALRAPDPAHFTFVFTWRVAAYLSLIAAAALILWMSRTYQTPKGEGIRAALHLGWILFAFLLMTVECTDYFRSLEATMTDRLSEVASLFFYRMCTLTVLWILFSVPLVIVGKRRSLKAVMIPGFTVAGLAWLIAAVRGFEFTPIADFQVVVNVRSGTLLLVSAAFVLFGRIFPLEAHGKNRLSVLLEYAWIVLIFILCTGETVDFFHKQSLGLTGATADELVFTRFMALGGVWTLYALVLGWIGRRTQISAIASAGLWVVILATLLAAIRGVAYDPVQAFTPVFNIRVAVILLAVAGLNWFLHFFREGIVTVGYLAEIRSALRVLTVVLILVLVTGEIRDFFEKAIAVGGSEESSRQLENLKQLLLSSSWLVYSILLMVYGIWRRTRSLRMISIGLFGVAILKIFIYDLSFLDTLYRIFSFLGLGLILLAVSYLYQRYREVIFAGEREGSAQ